MYIECENTFKINFFFMNAEFEDMLQGSRKEIEQLFKTGEREPASLLRVTCLPSCIQYCYHIAVIVYVSVSLTKI